jgi:tRNA wybutosine-synthesizing protein 3
MARSVKSSSTLPIPSAFEIRKSGILSALAVPTSSYTDLSPKGSIDIGIRGLIDLINSLDGAVTTSSCAGRVSIFIEGRKERLAVESEGDGEEVRAQSSAVPGGKGLDGRWLFVSHDPLPIGEDGEIVLPREVEDVLHEAKKEEPKQRSMMASNQKSGSTRLVRFAFEPMVSCHFPNLLSSMSSCL